MSTTLTKADVIAEVARRSGVDRQRAAQGVGELLEMIKGALALGETIELRGFGTFRTVASERRLARNPNTGEIVRIPPRVDARFVPHKRLKTLVMEHFRDDKERRKDEGPPSPSAGEVKASEGLPASAERAEPKAPEGSPVELAQAAAARGAWLEAVQFYEKAVMGAPQNAELRMALGEAYATVGEWHKAADQYRAVLAANPRDVRSRTRLAAALWELWEYSEATEEARRASETDPGNIEARLQHGLTLYRRGLYARAAGELERVTRSGDHASAHYTLGQTYNHLGQLERALAALQRALEIESDDPDTCWQLGIIYDKLKRREDALAMYRRANALRAASGAR